MRVTELIRLDDCHGIPWTTGSMGKIYPGFETGVWSIPLAFLPLLRGCNGSPANPATSYRISPICQAYYYFNWFPSWTSCVQNVY